MRGDEISDWLQKAGADVESFVILDDGDDMAGFESRLVQTDFETGLSMAHAEEATAMLRSSSGTR